MNVMQIPSFSFFPSFSFQTMGSGRKKIKISEIQLRDP